MKQRLTYRPGTGKGGHDLRAVDPVVRGVENPLGITPELLRIRNRPINSGASVSFAWALPIRYQTDPGPCLHDRRNAGAALISPARQFTEANLPGMPSDAQRQLSEARFTVVVESVADAWYLTVSELPATWTVAFSAEEVEARIRERIALDTGLNASEFGIQLVHVGGLFLERRANRRADTSPRR